jgi:hypothetical protein
VSFAAAPVIDNGGSSSSGNIYRFANAAGAINENPAIDILQRLLSLTILRY